MTIADMQRRLQVLGHDPGPADGIGGPKTAAALEAFLRAQGLPMRVTATASTLTATGPVVAATAPPSASGAQLYQTLNGVKYEVREIIVHCAATRPAWMADRPLAEKVAEIRRWHKAQGWTNIGYHWVIDRNGAVQAGRPETTVGAHVVGHNTGTIGICLLGGFGAAATDRFANHFTAAQDTALRQMIAAISTRARIERITGHNQYAAKGCPGFHVPTWLKGA